MQQVIIARGLVERGYRVSFICLDFGQDEVVEIDGVRILRAYDLEQGWPGVRFFWPRFTSIWNCLKRADADIYYQRAASRLTGIISVFCRLYGRKSVFAAAGNPDLEPNTPRIHNALDRRIFEYGLQRVDKIIVQNSEQRRLCTENVGRECVHVPNCYPEPRVPLTRGSAHVLWVSTLRGLKRPGIFLDVASALPQHKFRMVGGPARDERRLFDEIRVRASGISNVEFIGYVPYSEIDVHFDAASVFVNTSESEGFPNTFLQAWSRGIPTVSFIDAGARLMGEPIGRVVASREEMIAAIAELLADDSERRIMGAMCVEYFQQNHSPDRVFTQYAQVFQELCAEDGKNVRGSKAHAQDPLRSKERQ